MTKEEFSRYVTLMGQTAILPFYIKMENEEFIHAGTLTLVEYKGMFWAITAGHGLPESYRDGIFIPHKDGGFYNLLEVDGGVIRYDFKNNKAPDDPKYNDITIFNFIGKFGDKNYYKLDSNLLEEYDKKYFGWSGFPLKKSQNFHRTKDPKKIMKSSLKKDEFGKDRFHFMQALTANIKLIKIENNLVWGYEDLKDVHYAKDNIKKEQGYSLKGMSGGAIFLYRKPDFISLQEINNDKDFFYNMFLFIGIGIEHRNRKEVIGIYKDSIIAKLDILIDDVKNTLF
ncbi:hypothetical protein [Haemophilus sp.]